MIKDEYDYGNVKREILIVLKELLTLRVLIVRNLRCQDLCYTQFLKHLRYLDISDSTQITTLPDSICDLLNLQTLKLNGCHKLKSLHRNMRDLINLRHLYLEHCNGLKYMPRGIGQLKHLKTLSLFVIGKKVRDCQLDELQELDIRESLEIKNLQRVNDASIARGVSMAKMSGIKKLELEWRPNDDVDDNESNSTRHEKIGEALEVSSVRLKMLVMNGYKGVNLPKWVGKSSSSLTWLELRGLDNVNTIVSNRDDNEMIVLFPLLEDLVIDRMKNLKELVSPIIPSPGSFSNLCRLDIYYCPKLGALPPLLKELKHVTVKGECSDKLLYSISNLSALTHLRIEEMNERSVLFGVGKALMFDDEIPSSSQILGDNNNNEAQLGVRSTFHNNEAQLGVHSTFQSLQSLNIQWCSKLRRLFDEGMIMQETLKISGCQIQPKNHHLQGQTQRTRGLINSLTHLRICYCPELMISVEEFGNLNINNSLQRFIIWDCPKLVSSEEADDSIALLRSLRTRLGREKFRSDILLEEEEEEQSIVESSDG